MFGLETVIGIFNPPVEHGDYLPPEPDYWEIYEGDTVTHQGRVGVVIGADTPYDCIGDHRLYLYVCKPDYAPGWDWADYWPIDEVDPVLDF